MAKTSLLISKSNQNQSIKSLASVIYFSPFLCEMINDVRNSLSPLLFTIFTVFLRSELIQLLAGLFIPPDMEAVHLRPFRSGRKKCLNPKNSLSNEQWRSLIQKTICSLYNKTFFSIKYWNPPENVYTPVSLLHVTIRRTALTLPSPITLIISALLTNPQGGGDIIIWRSELIGPRDPRSPSPSSEE